jgi:hypothetical protein
MIEKSKKQRKLSDEIWSDHEDLNENIKSVNYVIFGKSDVAPKLKPNDSKRKRSKSPKQDKIKKPLAQLEE